MISFAVLLVAVFLGAANAQEPRCSETPATWSGYIYLVKERFEQAILYSTLLYIDWVS